MAILPIADNSTTQYDTTQSPYTNSNDSSGSTGPNGFLIAIEVIFSLLALVILLFCFLAGLKRKKRMRQLNQEMIENAIHQQERRIQLHLQGHCHSSSTITTLIQYPPPSYSPPDPLNQLSNDTVSRLDHLLLENQMCSRPSPSSTRVVVGVSNSVTLPKYCDLYQDGVSRPPQ